MDVRIKPIVNAVLFALAEMRYGPRARHMHIRVGSAGLEVIP
jgi:hypothetical protein